jgi:hypothetical protein
MPGSTGVPPTGGFAAEPTCASCHDGFPLNPDPEGSLELSGLPERYLPGARYALRLRVSHPAPEARRFGFQLTAIGPSGGGEGEFALTDPVNTQVFVDPVTARSYLEHTLAGTAPGRAGGTTWTFDWIAPATAHGDVAFFGAANVADLDGSKSGDRVFTKSPEPLAVVRAPGPGEGERP